MPFQNLQNKEQEAKEGMKKKIKELEMQKREANRKSGGLSPSYLTSFAQSAGFKKFTSSEPVQSIPEPSVSLSSYQQSR
jgi:hypothetical protein